MKQMPSRFSIAVLIIVFISIPVLAQVQMADSFGVDDAIGSPNTSVIVPVNIANVSNGPIQSITFDVLYDSNAISLDSIQAGILTANWENILLGTNKKSITLATSVKAKAITNGSTGSIVLLNFNIKNMPGASSRVDMFDINFANTANIGGFAPAKNGTFSIKSPEATSTPTSTLTVPSVTPAETERPPAETPIAETPTPIQAFPTPSPTVPGFLIITSILAILYIYLNLKK